MKTKLYFSIILLSIFFSFYQKGNAQAPNWQWAKSIGGPSDDFGLSIALDSSGNVYTTSIFLGTVDFDPGPGTCYLSSLAGMSISKLDASGNFVWAKVISGTGPVNGLTIVLDASQNIFIAGGFQGTVDFDPDLSGTFNLTSGANQDIFIVKLDSAGNFIWVQDISGTQAIANSMAIDASGNIYTTGSFAGTVDFDPGFGIYNLTSLGMAAAQDIFISKLDSLGNFLWAKAIGDTLVDNGNAIALDTSGNVYTTGVFVGAPDFDPGSGTFKLTAAGSEDIFISKLDSLGNFVWAKAISGMDSENCSDISLDASGNVYTTGSFYGTVDFNPGMGIYNLTSTPGDIDIFISKLDSIGNFVWAKKIGGTGNFGSGSSLVNDASGNVYTTGWFRGTADFNPGSGTFNLTTTGYEDIFISKLDSSGNFIWAKATGGTDSESGYSMAIDDSDNLYLAGNFYSSSIFFDAANITNASTSSDIYIAKLGAINTGIESIENNNSISLYPNPTTNHLTISLPNNSKKTNVTIRDIAGKIIYKTSATARQKIEMSLRNFPQGIYFVQIQTPDFIETKKLVVGKQ